MFNETLIFSKPDDRYMSHGHSCDQYTMC